MSAAYTVPTISLVSIIPSGGWRVEFASDNGRWIRSFPLVGWGLRADGSVVALQLGDNDEVVEVVPEHNWCRIYHPDPDGG